MAQKHIVSVLVSINTVSLLFLPPAECRAGGPSWGVGRHTHSSVACSEQDSDISGPDPLGAELLRRMAIDRKKAQNWGCWGSGWNGMCMKGVPKWTLQARKPVEVEFFSSFYSSLQAKSTQSQRSGAQSWGGRLLHLCHSQAAGVTVGPNHCSHDKGKLGSCQMTDERAVRNEIVCPTWFI